MEEIPDHPQEQVTHEMSDNTDSWSNAFPGVSHVRGHESAAQRYNVTRLQAGFPNR